MAVSYSDYGSHEGRSKRAEVGPLLTTPDGLYHLTEENAEKIKESAKTVYDKGTLTEVEAGLTGGEEDGATGRGERVDLEERKRAVDSGTDPSVVGTGNTYGKHLVNREGPSPEISDVT